MSNILEIALDIASEIKTADKIIGSTAVGDTCDIDVDPNLDLSFIRLKGNKKVKIVGLVLERTQ